ncbi:hypothetical protein D3C87_1121690 [compost metagenome]
MLTAYKIALIVVVYFAVFYLICVDDYRKILRQLMQRRRDQLAYYINVGLGIVHLGLGFYVVGCIIYAVWSL